MTEALADAISPRRYDLTEGYYENQRRTCRMSLRSQRRNIILSHLSDLLTISFFIRFCKRRPPLKAQNTSESPFQDRSRQPKAGLSPKDHPSLAIYENELPGTGRVSTHK